jgi:hypothetical protein
MVFIFDLGTTGDGSANSTIIWEITQPGSTPPVVTGPTLPLDFWIRNVCFDFDGGALLQC